MIRESLMNLLLITFCLLGAVAPADDPSPFNASTTYDPSYPASFAFDGDPSTRWASRVRRIQPEYLEIDFGESIRIGNLMIRWERAFAKRYRVRVSDDRKTWRTIFEEKDGRGGIERIPLGEAKGRYLRFVFLECGPHGLYSIWEIEFEDPRTRQALADGFERIRQAHEARRVEARRSIMKDHGVRRVVFAERARPIDPHWYANFGYYADDVNRVPHRPFGRLCVLDLATGEVEILLEDEEGSVRDPVVHYDGSKILFSYREGRCPRYHLFEIGVDGTGLRRLTSGDHDDIEPTYLPDGGIAFISTRCNRWVNCWLTQVATLYRCDDDGSNIRLLSANIEHDNTPWVLHDGRILFQRWEYVDRSQVHFHHLWTANPDGTNPMVFYGNMHPGSVYIDAKPLPDSNRVVLIDSPGHGQTEHEGAVAIIDPSRGPDCLEAKRIVSKGWGFRDPFPLSEKPVPRGGRPVALSHGRPGKCRCDLPGPRRPEGPVHLLPRTPARHPTGSRARDPAPRRSGKGDGHPGP